MAEYKVAGVGELAPGEMKQVQAGRTTVLLVRLEDGFHAVGALCSHYDAPLAEGALCGERVICPWHHACFEVRSGRQLEPPGLDGLPVYPLRVENGEVWVTIPERAEIPSPPRRDPADRRTCVVVGGGCAGAYAVEALRDQGFSGRIVWITGKEFPPVDRPVLSKGYLSGEASEAWLPLRPAEFYPQRDIEVMQRQVVSLDAGSRTVVLDSGETFAYHTAVLATGAVARELTVPGGGLAGVFPLHTLADCRSIREALEGAEKAVVVGASFIGLEVAQSLRKRGLTVTVVAPEAVPFEAILGRDIGLMLQRLHRDRGVSFRLGHTVQAFEGDGQVRQVRLDDGNVLEADLVVVGVGVRPATDFVTGVKKADDGSIEVDETLEAADGLFAAGDLARFPDWRTGERIRVEHWRLAAQHGRIAGANAAGGKQVYRGVPYFWTRQYGLSLHYFGHVHDWDEIRIEGKIDCCDFIAYYLKNGRVHAVAGMGRERDLGMLEERLRREGLLRL